MTTNQTQVAAATITVPTNEAGFIVASLPIQKTENKKYVTVGNVEYYVPSLQSFGIDASVESISEEDGLPVYADEKHDWLFSAIVARVAGKVKGQLQPKSISLKDGGVIPANWVEMLAEGKRGGASQFMAMLSELRKAFEAYIDSLNKSAGARKLILDAFANPKGVELGSPEMKEKLSVYFDGFVEYCEDADLLDRGQKYLEKLSAACEVSTPDDF